MDQKMKMPAKVPKAFPNVFWREDDGMDLRDYFAAKAMQGIVSQDGDLCDANYGEPSGIAYAAYHLADAMMKAREA